jgi:hypothetical protein
MKITEKIVDVVTGEENIVERDATPQEIAEAQQAQARAKARALAQAEAEAARAALLAKLGITEEEAKLLLGGN